MSDKNDSSHPPLGSDPLVGAQFGPYRIIGRIADGERGEIYFAEAPEIQRKVAVKVLREEYCRDQEAIKEFHSEIKLIKEISHDNVAEVYDVGWTTDKRIYVVMERLQGETLQDRIDRGPLPFPEAVPIFGQALAALGALHQRGVIHRDLRPDRIFLCPRPDAPPKVKILGLGVSRLINLDDLRKRLPKLSATSAAAVAAHYLSPEQIVNKPVDPRTDIFAMGIILFEAFTGQLPFAGVGVVQVLAKQAQGQIPALPELDPALQAPPELRDVVAKATRREPNDRFQDIARFMNTLEELANSRGISLLPQIKTRAPVPAPSFPTPSAQQLPVVAPPSYQTPAPGQPSVAQSSPFGGYQAPMIPQYHSQPNIPAAQSAPMGGYQAPNFPPNSPLGQPQLPAGHYPNQMQGQPPQMTYPTPPPGQPNVAALQSSPMAGYPAPNMGQPQYQYPPPNAAQSAPPGGYPAPLTPSYQQPAYQPQPMYPQPGYDPRATSGSYNAYNPSSGNFQPNPVMPPMQAPQSSPSNQNVAPQVAAAPLNTGMSQWGAAPKKSGFPVWVIGLVALAGAGGYMALKSSPGGTNKVTKTQKKEAANKISFAYEKVDERCLPLVRKALDSEKPAIKARAIEILGNIQDTDRLSDLRARVTDKDPNVRAKAAKVLARLNDKASIPKLQELRKTADTSVQLYLDEALFRLGDKEAERRLEDALSSKDVQTQLQAALALAELGRVSAKETLLKLQEANLTATLKVNVQTALARLGESDALLQLTSMLKGEEAQRVFSAESLYRIGYNEGQETLQYIFNDKKSPFLLLAARALARPGNKEIETFFVEASQSKSPQINIYVAEGLAKGGQDESSARRLWEMLDETEDEEQLVAISGALLQMKSRTQESLQKKATSWLDEALASSDTTTRTEAIEALAAAEPSFALPYAQKALKDPEPLVVAAAARTLGLLGEADALKGLDAANPIVAVEVGAALLRGNDSHGSELLRQAFTAKDDVTRGLAVQAATFAGDPSMAREALSRDKNAAVRFMAAFSLATVKDESGAELLIDSLKKKDETPKEALFALWLLQKPQGENGDPLNFLRQTPASIRPLLIRSLYKLSAAEAAPILQLGLTDGDAATRRAAIIAMSRYPKAEQNNFLPLYLDALVDSDANVRGAAILSILRSRG